MSSTFFTPVLFTLLLVSGSPLTTVAADDAAAPCNPAATAATGDKARGLGRLAQLGGSLAGRLGVPGASRTAADVAAVAQTAAEAGAVAGSLTPCTPTQAAAAANPAPAVPATATSTMAAPAPAVPATAAPAAVAAGVPAEAAPAPANGPRFSLPRLGNSGKRNCGALGAGCADGLDPVVACLRQKTFWGEYATAIAAKRDAAPGLSAAQRAALDADIASMAAAHAVNAHNIEPADPANPDRYLTWFSREEQGALNSNIAQTINAHRRYCNSQVRF